MREIILDKEEEAKLLEWIREGWMSYEEAAVYIVRRRRDEVINKLLEKYGNQRNNM